MHVEVSVDVSALGFPRLGDLPRHAELRDDDGAEGVRVGVVAPVRAAALRVQRVHPARPADEHPAVDDGGLPGYGVGSGIPKGPFQRQARDIGGPNGRLGLITGVVDAAAPTVPLRAAESHGARVLGAEDLAPRRSPAHPFGRRSRRQRGLGGPARRCEERRSGDERGRRGRSNLDGHRHLSAYRAAGNPVAWGRCTAGAGVRCACAGRRPFPASARPSRRCARSRTVR